MASWFSDRWDSITLHFELANCLFLKVRVVRIMVQKVVHAFSGSWKIWYGTWSIQVNLLHFQSPFVFWFGHLAQKGLIHVVHRTADCLWFLAFHFADSDQKSGEGKKQEYSDGKKECGSERKITMKTLSKTVAKLSPKAQRRKEKCPSNVAKLQVAKTTERAHWLTCWR